MPRGSGRRRQRAEPLPEARARAARPAAVRRPGRCLWGGFVRLGHAVLLLSVVSLRTVPVRALCIFPRAFAAARCSRKASSASPGRTPATQRAQPAGQLRGERAPRARARAGRGARGTSARRSTSVVADAGDVPAREALRRRSAARRRRTTLAARLASRTTSVPGRQVAEPLVVARGEHADHRRHVEQREPLDQPHDVADQARAQADRRAAVRSRRAAPRRACRACARRRRPRTRRGSRRRTRAAARRPTIARRDARRRRAAATRIAISDAAPQISRSIISAMKREPMPGERKRELHALPAWRSCGDPHTPWRVKPDLDDLRNHAWRRRSRMSPERVRGRARPAWGELDAALRRAGDRPERLGARRRAAARRALPRGGGGPRVRAPALPGRPAGRRGWRRSCCAARATVYARSGRRASLWQFLTRGYWRRLAERPVLRARRVGAAAGARRCRAALWGCVDPPTAAGLIPAEFQSAADPPAEGRDFDAATASAFSFQVMTNNIQVTLLAFAGGITFGRADGLRAVLQRAAAGRDRAGWRSAPATASRSCG